MYYLILTCYDPNLCIGKMGGHDYTVTIQFYEYMKQCYSWAGCLSTYIIFFPLPRNCRMLNKARKKINFRKMPLSTRIYSRIKFSHLSSCILSNSLTDWLTDCVLEWTSVRLFLSSWTLLSCYLGTTLQLSRVEIKKMRRENFPRILMEQFSSHFFRKFKVYVGSIVRIVLVHVEEVHF